MNKKAILPVVAVAAIGGIVAWRMLGNHADPNVIRLSGNIELTQVDLSFKTAGRISELTVDEGSAVTAGQMVARMESAELQKQIERERAGVDSASSAPLQPVPRHTAHILGKEFIHGAARQRIVPTPTNQRIVAPVSREAIITFPSIQEIIPRFPPSITSTSIEPVIPGTTHQRIVIITTKQCVVRCATGN